MPERAYIVNKVSKPAPGPEVILVLNSTEHRIYAIHKCKEVLAAK